MALIPRRNPLTSLLNFAADRDREANSLGSVISQIAGPALGQMGVQAEDQPQAAVMRGPAMAPTLVDQPVSDDFMRRLVKQESGGNPNAVSPKGATGLTQVMPSTAVDPGYGVPSIFDLADEQGVDYGARTQDEAARLLFDPDLNYQFGNLYANAMSKRFGGDPVLTAAAYNAGPGAVEQYGGVPPFAETQNYVNAVAGGGGDARLGGGMGADTLGVNSVEAILAQLYPQMSPEDEKRQRRKDLFAAASQGFSALSQGRPIDFSNIQASQEARKRQSVLDMRDRERARAAASYVLANGGDPATATAMATGAISPSDFLTSRQLAKAQAEADKAKLLDGQRADLLAPILKDLGVPEDRVAEVVEYGKAGGDITEILTQQQAAAAADKLREQEADQLELAQTLLKSEDPSKNMIGQLVLQGGMSIKDATDTATKMFPQAGGKEGTAIGYANALVAAGAINPATNQPYTEAEALAATILPAQAAGGAQPMVTLNPDGSMTITPPAPAAAGVAPAQAAVTTAAPAAVGAPTGVAGAFNQQFGGMGTGIPTGAPAPAVAAQALPLDVATQVADLEQKRLDLQQAREAAPDEAAQRALDLQLGDINLQLAQLQLQEAQSATGLNQQEQVLRIATAQANLNKAEREIQDAEEGEKAASAKKELRLTATTEAGTRQISKLLGMAADWNPGVAGGFERFIAGYLPGSEVYDAKSLVDSLNANSIITTIGVMKESSATGATGFGATTLPEISAMQDQLGKLDPLVNPELFVEQLQSLNNFILDSAYGTQSQIAKNPNLTDAEKEFYSQRFDLRTGEIISLGLVPLDDGVVTMWQQGDIAPNLVITPDDMTPEERAIFDSLN
jgi:hypothetical protein